MLSKKLFIFFGIFIVLLLILIILKVNVEKKHLVELKPNPFKTNNTVYYKLSINKIFEKDHSWIEKLHSEKIITMITTGDVIPARSVNYKTVTMNNFLWPFEKTAGVLKNADLTLINLETPLLKDCPLTNEGMVFCGDQRNIQGLVYSGVDVAGLANNHSGNYGQEGIDETIKLLSKNNIDAFYDNIIYKKIKGVNFAFLGFNILDCGNDLKRCKKNITVRTSIARKNANIVLVAFHWGDEYTPQPNKNQVELAHLTIDNGADLIIGNHPHWIQPVEIYKDKFIIYAHGNFVFDQMWSEKTELGVIAKYIFYEKGLIDVQFFPIKIQSYGQPYFLERDEKENVLNSFKNESYFLSSILKK